MSLHRLTVIVVTVGIAVALLMILVVPRFTGIDGRVIADGGPPGFVGGPIPHIAVRALDPETKHVVAQTVTDSRGRFALSLAPGPYLLEARSRPEIRPLRVHVGLFGHTDVTLVAILR